MAYTRDHFLKIGIAQKGYKESPAGSNKTKFGVWYGMNAVPWCAEFVSWVYREDLAIIKGKFARTDTKAKALHAAKLLHVGHTGMVKGDVVFFAFHGSKYQGRFLGIHHVGICLGRLPDGRYITLEGNTSQSSQDNGGEVQIRYRAASSVAGYFRPKYAAAPVKKPAPKPPVKKPAPKPAATKKGVVTAKSGLRVRKGAGTKHTILGALPFGSKVVITKTVPGWYEIKFDGERGYVSNDYVRVVK